MESTLLAFQNCDLETFQDLVSRYLDSSSSLYNKKVADLLNRVKFLANGVKRNDTSYYRECCIYHLNIDIENAKKTLKANNYPLETPTDSPIAQSKEALKTPADSPIEQKEATSTPFYQQPLGIVGVIVQVIGIAAIIFLLIRKNK